LEIIAKHRYARSSVQKIRLITNLISGKKVSKALEELFYINKKASRLVRKVLESAIANAEHNNGIDVDNMKIKKIFVDAGPTVKRIVPRAKGHADKILKRTSHITVIISNF